MTVSSSSVVSHNDADRKVFLSLLAGDETQLAQLFAWLEDDQLDAVSFVIGGLQRDRTIASDEAAHAAGTCREFCTSCERYRLTPAAEAMLGAGSFGVAEFTSVA